MKILWKNVAYLVCPCSKCTIFRKRGYVNAVIWDEFGERHKMVKLFATNADKVKYNRSIHIDWIIERQHEVALNLFGR